MPPGVVATSRSAGDRSDPAHGAAANGEDAAADKGRLLPRLELPGGGGAIRGIDEKFATNLATGTGSTRVPIASSPGRGGFELSLSLAYDSGGGNGPFGLGWQLSAPAISRKTDKGLPLYTDAAAGGRDGESADVFVLSGAEDLVPVRGADGDDAAPMVFERGDYRVQRYRPRVEGDFARIERWTHRGSGETHWRALTGDNMLQVYGATAAARIADPERPDRVFSWLLEETRDDRGNVAHYAYKAEDGAGIDAGAPSESSRFAATSRGGRRFQATAQRYLKRIRYGNRAPLARDATLPHADDAWLFELVFDYGEHDAHAPTPHEAAAWRVRQDPFSSYRATFEVRTYRLCRRVLMFHRFHELGPAPVLVRSTDLSYEEGSVVTYLTSVVHAGYVRPPGAGDASPSAAYHRVAMPSTDFGYIRPVVHDDPQTLPRQSRVGIEDGVDGTRAQWVDLDGEGIPGVLVPAERAWYYKANRGSGQLDPPALLSTLPSVAELASGVQQLTDLGGDGRLDLVQYGPPLSGYFERTEEGRFAPFVSLPHAPNIDWADPNLRFVDIDGDGLPDAFITENDAFVWYRSRGKEGFEAGRVVPHAKHEQRGPAVLFDDGTETIQLADMSGDGLVDIVRVRASDVCYWPNLGHGRFGARVTLDGCPRFDAPEQFDPKRVRLADIDGSGPADIAYLGRDGVRLYFNQAGNGLSKATRLRALPPVDALSQASFVDLLGQGTACLVYSTPLPGPNARRVTFVDLMGGRKPHLLESVVNNLGAETRIQYAASTQFYLADKAAGKPWLTRLPFPVQVVERVEHVDHVAKTRLVTTHSYHHGFFDGVEREFRGFARVEQRDAESFGGEPESAGDAELRRPPVRTVTWFHTGAWLEKERLELELAKEYYAGDVRAPLLRDTPLPGGLSTREEREAARALRGSILRQEVYGEDGTLEAAHPYTVSERDYEVRVLQRARAKSPAAFFVHARNTLNLHYERAPDDPRMQHEMVLEVDEFGNTTRSAVVAYPRRVPREPEQARLWASVTERRFAHRASEPHAYRIGVPIESQTSELIGLEVLLSAKRLSAKRMRATNGPDVISIAELRGSIATAREVAFESPASGAGVARRTVDRERHFYYRDYADLAASRDDASGPLPLGEITAQALAHHSLRLAFTPGLLAEVYGERVDDALLVEGGYVFDDGVWWAQAGRAVFDPARFFLPSEAVDAFGHWSALEYDRYALLATLAKEPRVAGEAFSGNVDASDARFGGLTRVDSDYRVLAPAFLVDPNGNRTAVEFDALGMVIATAVLGKEGAGDGDTLADPTTRLEYDVRRWQTERRPAFVRTLVREQHGAANPRFQESFSYSDGSGNEVMRKIQAEPGPVPIVGRDAKLQRNADGSLLQREARERWTGTGRTVFDNKGNPVKKYEPFFSASSEYEDESELVEFGVTPIFHYDPLGRRVRTDDPNGTLTRVVFDAWAQESWDANDTVAESRWLAERRELPETDPERRSARLALEHANTPSVAHLDALSRVFLTLSDNGIAGSGIAGSGIAGSGIEGKYPTRIELDVEGNQRRITDARGNRTVEQTFDLLGRKLRIVTADAGDVRTVPDVHDKTLRAFDARGLTVRHRYDALERPTHVFVRGPGGAEEVLSERTIYGEQHPDAAQHNLRAKLTVGYDSGGAIRNVTFDFKGNLLASERRLSRDPRGAPDWTALAELDAAPEVEVAAQELLEAQRYRIEATFDALNRMTTRTTPDRSQARLTYNEANLLDRVDVRLRGAAAWTAFVTDIDYNARGQRERIEYGNGTSTLSSYEEATFRLSRLRSLRSSDGRVLQDLRHTYDPVGNVVEIRDGADPIAFATREAASGDGRYRYDALYRLIEAEGREHPGQQPSGGDPPLGAMPHRNDLSALRRYAERYAYDSTGNLLEVAHRAREGSWTRRYSYAEDSNRLLRSSAPFDREGDAGSETYAYDANGNMTAMPHLAEMRWDFDDRLAFVDLRGGGSVHYAYDADGKRVRKVREHGGLLEERVYLGGYEIYRRHRGGQLELERETLHVMDNHRRVALVETKTRDADEPWLSSESARPRQRYQLDNHLRSSVVELDEQAGVISYEEYYPFGATAFHAFRSGGEVSAKRYRYIGQERDEETGLYHNGARYYAAWLGRWTSPDPAGLIDGTNVYAYSRNNPLTLSDPTGLWGWREAAVLAAVVVVGTVVTVATAGAAAPLAAAAVASIGLSGTAAAVATGVAVGAVAGAVGGAAAGAAGETTREVVHGEQLSLGKIAGAAGEGAVTGAAIGGAIGGAVPLVAAAAGAAASTSVGAAVIGTASRVGQGVARSTVGQVAAASGRAIASAAGTVAKAPGVRRVVELGAAAARQPARLEVGAGRLGVRAGRQIFAEGTRGGNALEAYNRSFSISQTFGSGAGRAGPPQGISAEKFDAAADVIREAGARYGDDIVVQGSRAAGTARPTSDIDFAIRVSPERFEQILKERFKTPNPGSALERTLQRATETGKIQTGELGLRGPRNEAQRLLGLQKVDLSVIKARGPFDQGPFMEL
jgi:RHS repeat-associated protein